MSDQIKISRVMSSFNTQRIQKGLLAIIVVVLASVLGLWGWRTLRKAPAAALGTASQSPGTNPQAAFEPGAMPEPADIVATTLGSNGFTPTQIKHAAGAFQLKVNNQSKQQEIVLRLTNATGEKLSEVTVTNKVHAWVGKFDLGPGAYTLSEAGHPKWTCRITVAGFK